MDGLEVGWKVDFDGGRRDVDGSGMLLLWRLLLMLLFLSVGRF